MNALPRIAITMGDAGGIGPEICLRLMADSAPRVPYVPLVFGDASVFQRVAEQLHLPFDWPTIGIQEVEGWRGMQGPCVVDFGVLASVNITPGVSTPETGAAAYRYVEAAINAALQRQVDAVATAPINKEALHAAGISFPGHTEILIDHTRATRACMMLTSPEITCSLVTTHVGYTEVASLLTVERIQEVIELTADAMRKMLTREPQLAVCGLNPHAGESGLFGEREEERFIAPAIARASKLGIQVIGPWPADTAFLPSRRECVDAYVCMYHDQGLIPLKTLAFDRAVNVTLGLPIVRTSVDHGTANDIAWQGKAQHTSLVEAVSLAARLVDLV